MRVSNVIEISLASLVHPSLEQQRRLEIQGLQNDAKRLGSVAIHSFVVHFPEVAKSVFCRSLNRSGYDFVGAGSVYSAYRKNDVVTKVHRRSIGMTEGQRLDIARDQDEQHNALAENLADFMVGQSVAIAEHPTQPRKRAVQIEQPFVSFEPLPVFSGVSDNINKSELEASCSRYPVLAEQWLELARQTGRSYDSTGVVPDLTGMNNIGLVDSERLILIDGQPVTPIDPVTVDRILRQADQVLETLVA